MNAVPHRACAVMSGLIHTLPSPGIKAAQLTVAAYAVDVVTDPPAAWPALDAG